MKSKILKFFISFVCLFVLGACSCNIFEIKEDDTITNDNNDTESKEENNTPWENVCNLDIKACPVNSSVNSAKYDTIEEAYNATVSSVVTILTYNSSSSSILTSGSGFIYSISSDSNYVYIMTNGHVVDYSYSPAEYLEIIYYNDVRVKGEVIVMDAVEDIAIVKAKKEPNNDFSIALLGDSEKIVVGEEIYTIGSPLGLNYNNTLTSGVVSGINVTISTDDDNDGNYINMYMTQSDAALSSGNSGGPLFNMKGEVIGINTLKLSNSGTNIVESFNFSIRINKAIKVANILLKKGVYVRPLIGITVYDIKSLSLIERERLQINDSIYYGLYINDIVVDSASYGILSKDTIIIKINDVDVTGMENFSVELLMYSPNEAINVTVIKKDGSEPTTYNLILK